MPGAPRRRPAARLLQPPGLRRADGRRHARRARRPARGGPARRAPGLRHPLDPAVDERAQRPARWRLRRPAPGGRRRDRRAGARGDRSPLPLGAGLLLALGAAAGAVAGAGRQRPPPDCCGDAASRASRWCRSASSPTTWRSSTTSTPRPGRPREELGLPYVRAATAGVDPRFVAMVRDLLLERSAAERGEQRRTGRGRRSDAAWEVCAAGLLPQPARPSPRPVRPGLSRGGRAGRTRSTCSTLAVSAAREAGELAARDARRGRRRGRAQVQPHRRGHRGRPRLRGADPRAPARRPSRRRLLRRGGRTTTSGTSGVRWIVDPIDGTVNYLYGLPHYAVSVAAEQRRPGRRGGRGRSRPRAGVRRRRWAGAPASTAYPSGARETPPLEEALVGTGFSYERRGPRAPGRGSRPDAAPGARHPPHRLVRARPVRRWPPARSTPTSRRGRTCGTTPPVGWSRPSAAPGSRCGRRLAGTTWWCARRSRSGRVRGAGGRLRLLLITRSGNGNKRAHLRRSSGVAGVQSPSVLSGKHRMCEWVCKFRRTSAQSAPLSDTEHQREHRARHRDSPGSGGE